MPFRTRCACGAIYTVEQWRALPRAGIIDVERDYAAGPDEETVEPIELRTCSSCRSTIGKPIPYAGGSDYPPSVPSSRKSRLD